MEVGYLCSFARDCNLLATHICTQLGGSKHKGSSNFGIEQYEWWTMIPVNLEFLKILDKMILNVFQICNFFVIFAQSYFGTYYVCVGPQR